MSSRRVNPVKNTLDTKLRLAHNPQVSEETLRLEEGSLYPALHRMTQSGWLRSEWGVSENNRRARFYSITAAGRKQLEEEEHSRAALSSAVARLQVT